MLKRTRLIWKRRLQAHIFKIARIQDLIDEQEHHALEDHMGFRGQFAEHRRFQISELKKLGLRPSHSVLEIGCGPLTAGIPVIQYLDPGNYVGVDVRSSVLEMAWQQIGKQGLANKNPRLIRSDEFGSDALDDRRFDYIWSFSVLYHLSDEILDRLFANVATRLKPSGTFVANVQTDLESSTWLEFPFLKRSLDDYRQAASKHGLSVDCLGTLEQLGLKLDAAEKTNLLLRFARSPT